MPQVINLTGASINILSAKKMKNMKCAFVLILLLNSMYGFSQEVPTVSSIKKNIEQRFYRENFKTGYSKKVDDMLLTCIAEKALVYFKSLSPQERKEYAKREKGFAEKSMSECAASTMATVLEINEGANKIEVFDAQFLKSSMLKAAEPQWAKLDASVIGNLDKDVYIQCVYDKIKFIVPTGKEYSQIRDPNGYFTQSVFLPCFKASVKNSNPNADKYKFVDGKVVSKINEEKIPTIQVDSRQAIGVIIGGKSYYPIIDSGASYFVVSENEERDMLIEGIISKSSYLEPVVIQLADGGKQTVRRFVISEIILGGFLVTNVEACVLSKAPQLLLGKSFLDRFKTWSLDSKSNQMILVKE